MNKSNKVVFGIFTSVGAAEHGVVLLHRAHFYEEDISLLAPKRMTKVKVSQVKSTKASEGAATGALVGGLIGFLLGVGALTVPGLAPVLAFGPIIASLTGLGVGGALGVVSGALIGYGIPESEARRYEDLIREGGLLVSVHVKDVDEAIKARHLLEVADAKNIAMSTELKSEMQLFKGKVVFQPLSATQSF